mgnify:FL=1
MKCSFGIVLEQFWCLYRHPQGPNSVLLLCAWLIIMKFIVTVLFTASGLPLRALIKVAAVSPAALPDAQQTASQRAEWI